MATTDLDHDQIKTKIATILKANTTLFTAATLTKIRSIEVGFPQGDPFQDQMFDYIFITNGTPFESITSDSGVVSNVIQELYHIFNYDIVIIVNGTDSRDAETKLDDFRKLVLETLEADANLTGTGSAEIDYSLPISVQPYRPSGKEGQGKKGIVITLRCFKTTGSDTAGAGEHGDSVVGNVSRVSIAGNIYKLKRSWGIVKDHAVVRDASSDNADYTFGRPNHSFSLLIEASTPDLPTIDGWTDEAATGDLTELAIIVSLPPVGGGSTVTASFNSKFAHSDTGQQSPTGKVLIRLDGVITSKVITWA